MAAGLLLPALQQAPWVPACPRPHQSSSLLNHTFVNVAHSLQHKRLNSWFDRLNSFSCYFDWLTHELVKLKDHFDGKQTNVGVCT